MNFIIVKKEHFDVGYSFADETALDDIKTVDQITHKCL